MTKKSPPDVIVNLSNIFVVGGPIVVFIYFVWFLVTDNIYFAAYYQTTCIWGITNLFILLFYFPAFFFSKIEFKIRVPLLSLLTISFCLSVFPALYSPTIKDTMAVGNYTYRLIMYDNFFDVRIQHYLVKCWRDSIHCETISPVFDVSGASNWPTQLLYDKTTNELHVFIRGLLVYTHGNTSREYKWEDGIRNGNNDYELYSFQIERKKFFRLAKCDTDTMVSCEILSFDYETDDKVKGNLVFDENTQELLILFDGVVTFAYGKDARKYDHLGMVISSKNLSNPQNHFYSMVYSLSLYNDSGIQKYILFECNQPFGWCKLLPFSYETTQIGKASIVMNSDFSELQVYVDRQLIFTYSEGGIPKCHANGCKIISTDN